MDWVDLEKNGHDLKSIIVIDTLKATLEVEEDFLST